MKTGDFLAEAENRVPRWQRALVYGVGGYALHRTERAVGDAASWLLYQPVRAGLYVGSAAYDALSSALAPAPTPVPTQRASSMPSYAMTPYRRAGRGRGVGRVVRSYQRRRAQQLIKRTIFRMAEMKHISTALSSSTLQATPLNQSLCLLSQGTATGQRIGNGIRVKRINLRAYVTGSASAVRDVVRVLVVLDNQPNGAAPTVSGAGGVLMATTVEAGYNMDTVSHGMGPQRYRVLFDRVIVLNQNMATSTKTAYLKRSWSVDIPVVYQANAGTISDLTSKNISVIAFSTTATNQASITGAGQICYIDA